MTDPHPSLARLTIVPNDLEAQMVVGLLKSAGINAMSQITNLAFGQSGEVPTSAGGPREILVRSDDLDAARTVLADTVSEQ